jgi:hypothetical protein
MNIIERNLIFEGTSYASEGDFSCGSGFGSLADLIRYLLSHPHGPGDPVISPQVTAELTQVATGLMTFVSSRSLHDASLRSRVAAEGLQRATKALAGIQQHSQTAN